MKKQHFALLVTILFLAKGVAQQVEEQQRSLITKRTADWCPYCGTWGWTYFKEASEQNPDKAIFVAAHYDGNLSIQAADEITSNFGGVSQPRFYFNNVDQGVSSGNINAKLSSLKTLIDDAFEQAPIANCGFDPIYEDGEIKVHAKLKFFQADQGEYWLGVYLLENNVVANQAGIGSNAVHQKLLRLSFTSESYGLPVFNGDIAENQEFELDYSLAIGDPTGYDYEVIGIIWKKEGNKFIPINTWGTNNIQVASATKDVESKIGLKVVPTVSGESFNVELKPKKLNSPMRIDVLDNNGKLVKTLFKGNLNLDNAFFTIQAQELPADGMYFVRVSLDSGSEAQKIIVRKDRK